MNETSKIDKIMNTTFFKIFCVADTLISIVSSFFAKDNIIAKIIAVFAILFMFITVCFLAFRYKKFIDTEKEKERLTENIDSLKSDILSLKENINLLEKNIHNGLKYTHNEAIVTMNKRENKYRFEFIKEFEVISDDIPKWYSAQFYANKILNDKDKSKNYYKNNVIKWDSLTVRAQISYQQPNSNRMTDWENLIIYNVSDESNYIPFNIQYTTYRNRKVLNLPKGTKVRLKYCYNVPVELWGSYLNRSISYFSEAAIVKLRYDVGSDLAIKVSMFLGKNGEPIDAANNYEIKTEQENEYEVCTITLKPSPFSKYRVWWDSNAYFSNDITTEDTADKSQLTNY